jgi:hypothetical protein
LAPLKNRRGWSLKEIGLLATVIVTTIGGIATTWTLYSNVKDSQKNQSEQDMNRAKNFAIFQTSVTDQNRYTQEQTNYILDRLDRQQEEIMERCRP